MEPLVTAGEMSECDRMAMKSVGVPGIILMENAGRAVAMSVGRHFSDLRNKRIFIFCGSGNNGGDGYVAARHLMRSGAQIAVLLVGSASRVRGDAKTNLNILKKLAQHSNRDELVLLESQSPRSFSKFGTPYLIIDALFGTGFSGKVKEPYRKIIEWINTQGVPVLAVDIPSGLNADNGGVEDVAVKADVTVTMGLRKIGLVAGRGPEHAGKIEIEGLGVPEHFFSGRTFRSFLVVESDVRRLLPMRAFDAHKHSVGKILVLAGSPGLTGAAAMVSLAAMRAGAGAVVLGTPKSVYPILARKLTEVMVEPLAETDSGSLSPESMPSIEKHAAWADVVVVGPGLSRHPETRQLVQKVAGFVDKPLLIDADGLSAFVEDLSALRKRRNETILTPHTGELSRLVGLKPDEIERDRISVARSFAEKTRATVVLKGPGTVTAGIDGLTFLNPTGNAGMATAGSGDVLAGVIAALRARGLRSHEAAYCGVYLHGLAGDIAREKFGEEAMMALDILASTGEALKRITAGGDE